MKEIYLTGAYEGDMHDVTFWGEKKRTSMEGFSINEKGYFKCGGADIMAFDDIYPAGHQSGIGLIMKDSRVASCGDVRFEPTPGQWQPVPKQLSREVDRDNNIIKVTLSYPDMDAHLRGFNPIIYPDFEFTYKVVAAALGDHINIKVRLDKDIPEELEGKLRFNMELFPGILFGKSWIMDEETGIFPRQCMAPTMKRESVLNYSGNIKPLEDGHASVQMLVGDKDEYCPIVADDIVSLPYAVGHKFVACPDDLDHSFKVLSKDNIIELYDGRVNHNNGWFVISSPLNPNSNENAVEWDIYPHLDKEYIYAPSVQLSAVGYHPDMPKVAVIELDIADKPLDSATLYRVGENGSEEYKKVEVSDHGNFLRYHYLKADFSDVHESGVYFLRYGKCDSALFRIDKAVFERGVWQPVLEYFLPVQMCHMRVNEKYRVWHGLCHNDDARMAPVNYTQFDGAAQGASTLTKYKPGDHVPGLNRGGWHDAGDFDLRIESQTWEIYNLSLAVEEFDAFVDETTIDQKRQVVEIHQPDGINDILQQIEHGLLSVVGGYNALGRLYHEIMSSKLRQYVLLGDPVNMTGGVEGNDDERWVFTEDNPERELMASAHLAAASRVIRDYNPSLSEDALRVARELFDVTYVEEKSAEELKGLDAEAWAVKMMGGSIAAKIVSAVELFITTGEDVYMNYIKNHVDHIVNTIAETGWITSKILDRIDDSESVKKIRDAIAQYMSLLNEKCADTPYGVMYTPVIWGAGWNIQSQGVHHYFLHKACPDLVSVEPVFNALNFILGCHPGRNKASFASGVGSVSATVAYGMNRADWSYIPGGVISGTALIRPDFPELLDFPYLWQQGEYVIGGGSTNYLLLVLAVRKLVLDK